MPHTEIGKMPLPAISAHSGQRDSHLDPLLTVKEGALLLRVSVPTFWRWVAQGKLTKPVKLGGFSRWPQSEIFAFIETAKAQRNAS